MFTVLINEGPLTAEDNAVYFTNEAPRRIADAVEASDGTTQYFRYLEFVPRNGHQAGNTMRVLYERVVSISEDAQHSVRASRPGGVSVDPKTYPKGTRPRR